MKKMRKVLSALLATSMAFSLLAVCASAADTAVPDAGANVPAAVRELAYMDITKATPEQKEAILDAREQIIYGDQAWTVNGAVYLITGDGTIETLPEFSDLFPGWDVPKSDVIAVDCMPVMPLADAKVELNVNYRFELYTGVNTKDFASFVGSGKPVGAYTQTAPTKSATYNIGYTDHSTGRDLGWVPDIVFDGNSAAVIDTEPYHIYGVRGSVHNTQSVGWYRVRVTESLSDRFPLYPSSYAGFSLPVPPSYPVR